MIVWIVLGVVVVLGIVAVYDMMQTRYAILRNFPVVGHMRHLLTAIGPELRQYIVAGNNEERPFSRDERHWVYTSAGRENNYFGFGTDNDLEQSANHLIIRHSAFPMLTPRKGEATYDPQHPIPCRKVLGGPRGRAKAYRMPSVINVSAMSFGSLSAPAVEAINRGCAAAGCYQNTGEGGVSPYHLGGADVMWQIGTGYFGCREADGSFSMERLVETTAANPQIKSLEIKLSQGAKPGAGGVLPKAKITPEIAQIRGIGQDRDVISPAAHSAFSDVDSLLDFVESLAEATGLPVGIKSAVGDLDFWRQLAAAMTPRVRGVDFIAIDGGEGGTGAAPLVFSDHVALPFKLGFAEVYRIFAEHGLRDDVVFIGAGKLGLPASALIAFGLGCDAIAVAREAMLAIGCIQAQRCHDNHCPTGVATQNRWLMRGLDPTDKGARMANYLIVLRKELLAVARACGVEHPADIDRDRLLLIDDHCGQRSLTEAFDLPPVSDRQG